MRSRWLLSGLMAATAGAVLAAVIWLPRPLRPLSGSPPSRDLRNVASTTGAGESQRPSDTCGCPMIKPLAPPEAPAAGKVELEMTYTDIEDQFSNRARAYKDNWDKAFAALDAAIDPKGLLHLARAPAPAREDLDAPPLREGYLSRQLIEGPAPPIRPGTRQSPAEANARLQSQLGSQRLTLMLVNTIARANKYGPSGAGLPDAAIRAARYLVDDLARASVELSDPRSLYIGKVQSDAFGMLMDLLSVATPFRQEDRAKRSPKAPSPGRRDLLPLDDFDRANAVLDVYLSSDGHEEHGIFTPPRGDASHDTNKLVRIFVALAAARKEFGGNAAPGSPQDAVACKAFNTLVRIADARVAGTAKMRSELFELLALTSAYYSNESAARNGDHEAPEPAMFAVTRSALTVAGAADEAEAKSTVDRLFEVMLAHASAGVGDLERMIDVLKFYRAHAGGDSRPTARADVAAEIQRRLEYLQKRKDAGVGSRTETQVLEHWNTQEVTAGNSQSPQPACPPPGQCEKEIAKEKPTLVAEEWETTGSIVFRPAGPRAVDATTDSLLRAEQFYVELRVPIDRARGDSADVTLRNARTGKTQMLRVVTRSSVPAAPGSLAEGSPFTTYMNPEGALLDLATENGDVVVAEFPGVRAAWVDVFDDDFKRTIDRVERGLRAIEIELRATTGSAANATLVKNKLQMIANARAFLAYRSRPNDRFFYTDRSRAYIGLAYLRLLNQSSFDQGVISADYAAGADARFPGVVYSYREESQDVNLALQRVNEQAQAAVLTGLAQGAIGLYRTALTAQCFELGGIWCPENYWVLTTGTTVTGEQMSVEDLALFGINLAIPLVFKGAGKLAELQYYSAAQYAPSAVQKELEAGRAAALQAMAAEAKEAWLIERRSEIIAREGTAAAELARGEVQIGSKRAFFVVPKKARFSGGRILIPQNTDPSAPRNYQITDDGCLLVAFEEARRTARQKPRSWKQSLDLAYERSVTVETDPSSGAQRWKVDLIYRPASVSAPDLTGTYFSKFERYMELDGAELLKVERGHRFNTADLELALSRQRQVIVGVRYPDSNTGHALLLREIRRESDGQKFVRFFNPSHGFDEEAPMCEFLKQWDRSKVKIFRFKKT